MSDSKKKEWYGAKALFVHDDISTQDGKPCYEERVVILLAEGEDQAISLAEDEANEYVKNLDETRFLGFISVFHTFIEELGNGSEVYSIMRSIDMEEEEFVDHYFDDGTFRTRG